MALTGAGTTTGGSVFRGGVWWTASRIIPQLYVLALSLVAARFLGPTGMGRQSFIAFVELSLVALLSQGLFFALMRLVGERIGGDRVPALHALIRWAWWVEGSLALVGGCILAAAGLLGAEPRNAWILAGVVCVVLTIHAVPTAVLIGAQRWRDASIVGLVTGLAATVAAIVVLSLGGGITGMFAVEAAIGAVNLLWTGLLARRAQGELAVGEANDYGDLRRIAVRAVAVLSLSEVVTLVVERRSEVLFLAHWSPTSQIAIYSIVYAVVTALVQVPNAMAAAVSPAVATLYGAGAVERIRSGYERALRLLLVTSLPITAGVLAVGPALLRVIYGSEYRATGPVLLVTMSIFPLVSISGLASALLTGIGRLRMLLGASAFAAAVDVGLSLLLVPRYDAIGAALANVGAQVVLTATLLGAIHWLAGAPRLEQSTLARAVLAALGAGLVAYAANAGLPDAAAVVVGLVAGTAVFLALAATLRILPRDDAAWLDQTLGRYLGGGAGRFFRAAASRGAQPALIRHPARW